MIVDTDILVDFLRGYSQAVEFIKENRKKIAISTVSVAELYAGVRPGGEIAELDEFIRIFQIIPVSSEIACQAGLFKRDYGKSHGISLADGILAASAVLEKLELKTLNIKHYPMLTGLKIPYRKKV